MIRRLVTSFTLAGLVVAGLPSTAHAIVADQPEPGYPSFDATVRTTAHRGGTLYVGGDFDTVTDSTGAHTRHGAAAIDVSTGRVLRWNPNVRGSVRDIAVGKEGVYLAGSFSRVRGDVHRNLARVSRGKGAVSRRFHPRTDAPVNTVTLDGRRILIGGEFTHVGRAERVRLAALKRSRPFRLTGWTPRAQNGRVFDIVRTRGGIYVAGEFRAFNGRPSSKRLVLVTRKTGSTVRSFHPAADSIIFDISVTRSRVFAAVGGRRGGGALAVTRRSGATAWERRFDGDAQAITTMRRQVYVGGHFNVLCNGPRQEPNGTCTDGSVSRLRGASLTFGGATTGWNPRANSNLGVTTFDRYARAERLIMGGAFTATNGGTRPARRLAVFEPTR